MKKLVQGLVYEILDDLLLYSSSDRLQIRILGKCGKDTAWIFISNLSNWTKILDLWNLLYKDFKNFGNSFHCFSHISFLLISFYIFWIVFIQNICKLRNFRVFSTKISIFRYIYWNNSINFIIFDVLQPIFKAMKQFNYSHSFGSISWNLHLKVFPFF